MQQGWAKFSSTGNYGMWLCEFPVLTTRLATGRNNLVLDNSRLDFSYQEHLNCVEKYTFSQK